MPADIRWDNAEKTILMVTFSGDIPKDEFLGIFDREGEMFASIPHTAYLLADFRELVKMPVDMLALSSMISRQIPANLGGIVFVGTNPVLETIFRVWSKLYRKMTMVKTMDDAYGWINKLKASQNN
jgi:hypothetical protein